MHLLLYLMMIDTNEIFSSRYEFEFRITTIRNNNQNHLSSFFDKNISNFEYCQQEF